MAYCKNCGAEIGDNMVICPKCGTQQSTPMQSADRGGFGWGLLGFLIPLVGLILFLVWKDEKPRTAKAAGIGALVSVILGFVAWVLIFVMSVLLASAATIY